MAELRCLLQAEAAKAFCILLVKELSSTSTILLINNEMVHDASVTVGVP